jgi:hypothetical protein
MQEVIPTTLAMDVATAIITLRIIPQVDLLVLILFIKVDGLL